jgi:hypothetical protein
MRLRGARGRPGATLVRLTRKQSELTDFELRERRRAFLAPIEPCETPSYPSLPNRMRARHPKASPSPRPFDSLVIDAHRSVYRPSATRRTEISYAINSRNRFNKSRRYIISFREPLSRLCFGSNSHALRRSLVDSPSAPQRFWSPLRSSPKKSARSATLRLPLVTSALGVATTQLMVARDRWAQKEIRKCTSIALNSLASSPYGQETHAARRQ